MSKYYKIPVHFEKTEKMYVVETVQASSKEEAEQLALKQFQEQTVEVLYHNSKDFWRLNPENRFGVQNVKIETTKEVKRPTFTPSQRKLIEILLHPGNHLSANSRFWSVRDSKNAFVTRARAVSVRLLLNRGLLIQRNKKGLSEQEIQIQLALGSIKTESKYILNEEKLKQFEYKK